MGRTVHSRVLSELHQQTALKMSLFGAVVEENQICELIVQQLLFLRIFLF